MEIVEELHAPFLMTQLLLILSVGGGGDTATYSLALIKHFVMQGDRMKFCKYLCPLFNFRL